MLKENCQIRGKQESSLIPHELICCSCNLARLHNIILCHVGKSVWFTEAGPSTFFPLIVHRGAGYFLESNQHGAEVSGIL